MNLSDDFSAKEFLKSRRPEEFSSSKTIETGTLDRVRLEHYLATLNKRSQELEFESFAKKLCEKIICSNLLEQTGPVAGGDGKTDTQTFPVSEQNQLLWYEGINKKSHDERWAFAVSTQKTWNAKCQKDVKKIVETHRGYVKVFCITNQFIKSDQRSKSEDELSKEYSIDVRIFDLSWILDQVYKNQLEFIAINTLNIPTSFKREIELSADDYQKQKELDRLNNILNQEVDAAHITNYQVDYFLEVAILSKELERPILETQSLFDRAVRIANKFGNTQQELEATYQYAWAAHWWFEDYSLFETNLELTFKNLTGNTNSENWEKIVNLLTIYMGRYQYSDVKKSVDIDSIYKATINTLNEISKDLSRPSNALMANIDIYLFELIIKFHDEPYCKNILKNILEICRLAQNLIGFPFEKFYKLFSELDIIFSEYEEFEDLLDYFTEQSGLRNGEVKTAQLQLERGIKRLKNERPYQAIKLLGRALSGLNKKETYDEMTYTNLILSDAYSQVGLQWASRGSLLFSASLLINYYHKEQLILPTSIKVYWQLAEKELELGRIPQSLQWANLALLSSSAIDDTYIDAEKLTIFDGCIAHLLLNCSIEQLKEFEYLPDFLENLQLFPSYGALIYILGYEDKFKKEFEVSDFDDHLKTILMLRDLDTGHPTSKILSTLGKCNVYSTKVGGCLFSVEFPNRSPFIELTESILTTIENFFSTNLIDQIYTKLPALSVNIIGDDDENNIISHDFKISSNGMTVDIYCSNLIWKDLERQKQEFIFDWFCKFIIECLIKVFHVPDSKSFLETSLREEMAFTRSIAFNTCFGAIYNVMGEDYHKNVLDCLNGNKGTRYELIRAKSWDFDLPKVIKNKIEKIQIGDHTNIPDFEDPEKIKHEQIGMTTLIKPELWDRAKWYGLAFMCIPNQVPTIFLIFKSEEGEDVFMDLYEQLSGTDEIEKLRFSIIRGVSKNNPSHYRVQLTENLLSNNQFKLLTMISRIHEMTPQTDQNWNNFEQAYNNFGAYNLSFGIFRNNQFQPHTQFEKFSILKKEIVIKNAWEIGLNDIERSVMRPDDEPLIPKDTNNVPFLDIFK